MFFLARKHKIPPPIGSTWVGFVPLLVTEKSHTQPSKVMLSVQCLSDAEEVVNEDKSSGHWPSIMRALIDQAHVVADTGAGSFSSSSSSSNSSSSSLVFEQQQQQQQQQ